MVRKKKDTLIVVESEDAARVMSEERISPLISEEGSDAMGDVLKEVIDEDVLENLGSAPGTEITRKKPKPFFEAELRLRNIAKDLATYRVHEIRDGKAAEREGSDRLNIHHIQVDRSEFPKDDDFNMSFINQELSSENVKEKDLETFKGIVKKQAEFRKFMTMRMVIL